ncbi:MAG: tetratricopeptide repeat protein [Planctomycetota bacterium]
MYRFLAVLLLTTGCLCVLPAASDDVSTTHTPLVRNERTIRAYRLMEATEASIAEIRARPPAERQRAFLDFRDELEELVKRCTDTDLQNKAWYLLAGWHLEHGDPSEALPLLERIELSEYPAFKHAARAMAARVHLKTGDLATARQMAESVSGDIPEFANLLRLVSFYDHIGKPAPRTAGKGIASGKTDPAASDVPWLLYVFCNLEQADHRYHLDRLMAMLAPEEAPQAEANNTALQLVIVSFSINPLAALGHFRDLPDTTPQQLLWANPNTGGDGEAWRQAWGIPKMPTTVLLGPDRTVLAIDPGPEQLGVLLGRRLTAPEAEAAEDEGRQPGRRGGRRFNWR